MSNLEYCCECNNPTGRAGRGEDSLYTEDDKGPFCQDCFPNENLVTIDGVERILNCVFPDCGCDGARNCDAVNGAGHAALILNVEKKSSTHKNVQKG